MAQKFCTKCGAPLKEGLKFCPKCGEPVKNPSKQKEEKPPVDIRALINKVLPKIKLICAIVPLPLFIVGFIFGIISSSESMSWRGDRILFGFEHNKPVWIIGHIVYFILLVSLVFYLIAVIKKQQKSRIAKIIFNGVASACSLYLLLYGFIQLSYSDVFVGWLMIGIMNSVSLGFVVINLLLSIFDKEVGLEKSLTKKLTIAFAAVAIAVSGAATGVLVPSVVNPANEYKKALTLLDTDVDRAIKIFDGLSISDSSTQANLARARKAFKEQNYIKGIEYMLSESGFVDIWYDNAGRTEKYRRPDKDDGYYLTPEVFREIKNGRYFDGWNVRPYYPMSDSNLYVNLFFTNYLSEDYEFDLYQDSSSYYYRFNSAHSIYSIPSTTPSNVTVPASYLGYPVKTIGVAFKNNTHLQNVTLPSTITSIYGECFSGCTQLTEITFDGTKEQWDEISKDNWKQGSSITTIHCSDYDIVV